MPTRLIIALAIAFAGCDNAPQQTTSPGPVATPAPATAQAPALAPALKPPRPGMRLAKHDDPRIAGHRAAKRLADFKRHHSLDLPAGFSPRLTDLAPADVPLKRVVVELQRGLHGVQPAPGQRSERIIWLSLSSERALVDGLFVRLKAQGWSVSRPLPSHLVDPRGGQLTWKVVLGDEVAHRLDLTWTGPDSDAPLEHASALLTRPAPPLPREVLGYSHARYHTVRLGVVFSDVERLTLWVEQVDRLALTTALERAGYTAVPKKTGAYQKETGVSVSWRPLAKGKHTGVLIHRLDRWLRVKKER